jgi:hypothetical protein
MRDDARSSHRVRRQTSRRDLLRSGARLAGTAPLASYFGAQLLPRANTSWPKYLLRRESDELYLELTAFGYRERRFLGRRCLQRIPGASDSLLVFTIAPQHYAETAIAVSGIPAMFDESVLSSISLLPSATQRTLVFRFPNRDEIELTLEALLDWRTFELVLPDVGKLGAPYDLAVRGDDDRPFTRIEMPWGIDLTPDGRYGEAARDVATGGSPPPSFLWQTPPAPSVVGDWTELWTTVLRNSYREDDPLPFEVLGVRGFQRGATKGTVGAGDLTVTYSDAPNTAFLEGSAEQDHAASKSGSDRDRGKPIQAIPLHRQRGRHAGRIRAGALRRRHVAAYPVG